MKKVLSVAMASAMVLGMGANAFAIKYNVDSNDTAKWPTNFGFEGKLFVTDKNGDLVTGATTNINRKNAVDFQPGDVVWMPLYADDQIVYDSAINKGDAGYEGLNTLKLEDGIKVTAAHVAAWDANGDFWVDGQKANEADYKDFYFSETKPAKGTESKHFNLYTVEIDAPVKGDVVKYDNKDYTVKSNSVRYFIGAKEYNSKADFNTALQAQGNKEGAYMTVDVEGKKATDTVVGDAYANTQNGHRVAHGLYTGNIDKNWSINLIESKGSTVTDFVEKAELYKADEIDYHSYKGHNVDIMPNAVYVKVQLKKEWKTCDTANVKYHVYVANNAGKQTNKVYVEGKYAAPEAKKVDFTWSNDASVASLWKAEENGVAVFDFKDKAFFTVKMYKGECLYLDLDAAYKLATAREFDGEIDSFYYFDKENANFFREGELVIVSDNDELNVYEVTEDGAEMVEADYVKGHAVAHTNQKVNGYVFNTKELGNYVLAEGVEEEEVAEEEAEEAEEVEEAEEEAPAKVNPDTGANDFVGLAVSLAVVSVAAAGALALKK